MKCCVCEREEGAQDPRSSFKIELRPYGPNGAPICFECAMGSPEREAEAKRQFAGKLAFAGDVALLTEAGPVEAPGPLRKIVGAPARSPRRKTP